MVIHLHNMTKKNDAHAGGKETMKSRVEEREKRKLMHQILKDEKLRDALTTVVDLFEQHENTPEAPNHKHNNVDPHHQPRILRPLSVEEKEERKTEIIKRLLLSLSVTPLNLPSPVAVEGTRGNDLSLETNDLDASNNLLKGGHQGHSRSMPEMEFNNETKIVDHLQPNETEITKKKEMTVNHIKEDILHKNITKMKPT